MEKRGQKGTIKHGGWRKKLTSRDRRMEVIGQEGQKNSEIKQEGEEWWRKHLTRRSR